MFLDTYVHANRWNSLSYNLCYSCNYLFHINKMYSLNCILMQTHPLTVCSVDVSGRREMRSFFNGIVRLQVCVLFFGTCTFLC
jgi:hypothetical protein